MYKVYPYSSVFAELISSYITNRRKEGFLFDNPAYWLYRFDQFSVENKVKEESKKDEIFYSVLKNAITEQLNNAASKNDKTYFIANLISDIKTDFPYLKTYRKITKKDIEKCGFEIEFENDEKVKGFIKTK